MFVPKKMLMLQNSCNKLACKNIKFLTALGSGIDPILTQCAFLFVCLEKVGIIFPNLKEGFSFSFSFSFFFSDLVGESDIPLDLELPTLILYL